MYERKIIKTVPSQVKSGDLMAFVHYVKVDSVYNNGSELVVTDLNNNKKEIRITGDELISNALSADQYHETIKVSKSDAIDVLLSAYNRPLKISFQKKDGTERIMRCRFIQEVEKFGRSMVEKFGRSMVENLDIVGDEERIREVDHRELNWIILEGVRFEVKNRKVNG